MSMDDKLQAAFLTAPADSPFTADGVQFAWDSVSLTAILACPRRYQLSVVEGLVSKAPSTAIALVFGILFHKGLELYHKARFAGADHDAALESSITAILTEPATATLPSDEDVEEAREDAKAAADEDDGIDLRNSRVRTRYYLTRALIWYLEHYQDDPVKTLALPSGAPAVEVSFRLTLPSTHVSLASGHPVVLCGHIDRAADYDGFLYVSDYKTTKSISRQWKMMFDLSHQMSGYSYAGQVIFDRPTKGILIDGAALLVGSVKLGRHITHRSPGQIREYLATVKEAVEIAEKHAARAAVDPNYIYPLNTSACYFCDFKGVCSRPPEQRQRHIKMEWESRPGWNPLANR